ncbi:TIGR00341 family protein [Pontibacter akesuensis]|uniref:TIGR00341 family protein n=1 Tax=Pontibacter akesuensis TaxID=388950 RepID=A0A1I7G2G1_9BACT|nr:TIGR00341 family protein [Pontibacter akesuensis]GHA59190.1 membrane protein [Pontibacter akesuensis]SFU42642.1 TIGR00341 family protein [Pontibacter akesuensis]
MLFRAFRKLLSNVFNIQHQTDEPGTIREINDKIPIRGNNTWMLICSAMLASIGLDTGSGAVIIGAMLISPLMSPILGVGLSVGINDREMLVDSLKNLALAAAAGLVVSTFYFSITPLGEPTNELLARTQPTLLDVLVAIFGGVAGIISISRSDRSNAIPGVAIATALMPPLCTAGYGLAVGRMDFFFGGFYLFFINAVFISLSTYMIVKYLHFHTKDYVDKAKQQRVARIMVVMLVIVLLPSVYFLYNVYIGVKTKKQIESLVIADFISRNNEVLKWEVQDNDSLKYIKIYSVGKQVDEQLVQQYNSVLQENSLPKYRVKLVQLDVSPEEVEQIAYDITHNLTQDMLKTMELQKIQEQRSDSLRRQKALYSSGAATQDLKLLFPEIQRVQVGDMITTSNPAKPDTITLVMLDWEKAEAPEATAKMSARNRETAQKLREAQIKAYERRIGSYLSAKLRRDSVQVVSTY